MIVITVFPVIMSYHYWPWFFTSSLLLHEHHGILHTSGTNPVSFASVDQFPDLLGHTVWLQAPFKVEGEACLRICLQLLSKAGAELH